MLTIRDIALMAEVSTATVSRVINGKTAKSETREKVLKIIEDLNYTPSASASNLRASRTGTLGAIIPDISNPFYPSSIRAFYDAAKMRGYNIILGNTYGMAAEEKEVLSLMSRERVAGIMLETCEGEDWDCYPFLKSMIDSGVYIVLIGKKRDNLDADMISIDHETGAYKAVSYLLRLGRKRIGLICGSASVMSGEQRYAGYKRALMDKGIEEDNRIVSFDEWTLESGKSQAKKILKQNKIDGLFCANDLLAIGAMDVLKEKGVEIPEDVAVVGFDDIKFSSYLSPKLTTIHQPIERMASNACNLLIDRIEGKFRGKFREILVEPELIARESA